MMKYHSHFVKTLICIIAFVVCSVASMLSYGQSGRLWATYYGGSGDDRAYSVATDASGNVYIAAQTSSAGIASGGFQNTYGGAYDALLVKFDINGNRLWATYYGGSGEENRLT